MRAYVPARPPEWPGGGRPALGASATVPRRDSVGGSVEASLRVTGSPHSRVTRGLSPGCAKSWAPPAPQSGSGAGERRARVSQGRVARARGQGREAAGAWEGRRAGRGGVGHGGGSDSRPQADGPVESRVRGAWGTGDPERTGHVRDWARVPGRPGSAGPPEKASDSRRGGRAASSPRGAGWSPAPCSCAHGRRRSHAYPGERGRRGGQLRPRRPPRCGLRQPPPSPTQKLVATNRRPRVPLAASGGVGGRARGRGRLADAAASWWADPESPRKRGRLSAVRQARLCGSGSPLLQHSPRRSQHLAAPPSPSAALRRHCSSRPFRLRPPFAWLVCLKLPQTSAPPVPAAAGEYLPVVGQFAQLWPAPPGGGPLGLAKVRGRTAPTRAGSQSVADAP